MKLNKLLKDLKNRGCHPCISRRGNVWRAHVNGAGNFWEEASTPLKALQAAVRSWEAKGCIMDGYAYCQPQKGGG